MAGLPHHITQRGNSQQEVYFVDDDRRVYLQFLRGYAKRYRFQVHGYCLMRNHVHIIGLPETEDSLALSLVQRGGARGGRRRTTASSTFALWQDTLGDEARWRAVLERGADADFAEDFRLKTHIVRPLGSDGFLSLLEYQPGRSVRALPVGRPYGCSRRMG